MKKALITGSEGFVGKYLRKELEENGYEVLGVDLVTAKSTVTVDLTDVEQVDELIRKHLPDIIIHLAGQANVGLSWKIPQKTFEINVIPAINLMEAVRKYKPEARMVMVGSSDQYGTLGDKGNNVTEDIEPHPETPYAVSKQAQENMAKAYVKAYGLHICMTRSFNHAGAGQNLGFIIPDFCNGVVKIERGEAIELHVGNLESKRDYTHVQDVVRAYRLLAEKGKSGEVYNVGYGKSYSGKEIIDKISSLSKAEIIVKIDPNRMRPSDTKDVRADNRKIKNAVGWCPMNSIDEMIRDVLTFYRNIGEE